MKKTINLFMLTIILMLQMTVNSKIPSFNQNTTIEEMNKTAGEQLTLATGSESKEFRFEYANVDTTVAGEKTTKMNVYEKLVSGGEFMTTYDVKYIVNENPKVIEKSYDESGKELNIETKTFENGETYQPTPTNFMTVNDEVFEYQGWLKESQTVGKDKPTAGNPSAVSSSTTYKYVYKNKNTMINMTIPTELLFGTYGTTNDITSGEYQIKNNSADVKMEVIMGEFKKEKSSVTLLKKSDSNPLITTKKARLNLRADNKTVIDSLTEADKDKLIKELAPGEETTIGLKGKYYGSLKDTQMVKYDMILKFKAQ